MFNRLWHWLAPKGTALGLFPRGYEDQKLSSGITLSLTEATYLSESWANYDEVLPEGMKITLWLLKSNFSYDAPSPGFGTRPSSLMNLSGSITLPRRLKFSLGGIQLRSYSVASWFERAVAISNSRMLPTYVAGASSRRWKRRVVLLPCPLERLREQLCGSRT